MTRAEYLLGIGYTAKEPLDEHSFYKDYNDQIELNIHTAFLSYRIIPKFRDIFNHKVIDLEHEALNIVEKDFYKMLKCSNYFVEN